MYVMVTHKESNSLNDVVVAEVQLDDSLTDLQACETAWKLTQNIQGSWSMKDGNPDNDARVKVLAPLHMKDGKTYGLRSSMMFDQFFVIRDDVNNPVPYWVDMIGFEAGLFIDYHNSNKS